MKSEHDLGMDYQKLPADFKKKWVEALRSGRYKQGFEALRSLEGGENTYCCLGVACIVAGVDKNDIYNQAYIPDKKFDNKKIFKPVPDCLRLHEKESPAIKALVLMNDTQGKDFNQIADWIEENL